MSIQKIAAQFASQFETATREDGSTYVRLRDGYPEWMKDAIYDAHDGRLPCDYIYELCRDAVDHIAEYGADADAAEFADSAVSVYTSDRYAWLSDHLANAELVDEAREAGLVRNDAPLSELIGAGMYLQAERVFDAIKDAIEAEANDL